MPAGENRRAERTVSREERYMLGEEAEEETEDSRRESVSRTAVQAARNSAQDMPASAVSAQGEMASVQTVSQETDDFAEIDDFEAFSAEDFGEAQAEAAAAVQPSKEKPQQDDEDEDFEFIDIDLS